MQKVYDLNNEGATLIACGQTDAALRNFSQAQAAIREEALAVMAHGVENNGGVLVSFDALPVSIPKQTDNLFVYTKVFVLVGISTQNTQQGDIALCSAVLRYNMAITLQLLEQGPKSQGIAFRLYKQALRFLQPLTRPNDHGLACVSRLTIASLHNMAEVLYNNNDFDRASVMVDKAQALLEAAQVLYQDALFDVESMVTFVWSSHFLHYCAGLPHSAAAA